MGKLEPQKEVYPLDRVPLNANVPGAVSMMGDPCYVDLWPSSANERAFRRMEGFLQKGTKSTKGKAEADESHHWRRASDVKYETAA